MATLMAQKNKNIFQSVCFRTVSRFANMSRGILLNGDSSERDHRDHQRRYLSKKRRKSNRCAAKTEHVNFNSDSKSKENKQLRDMIVNHLDSISRFKAEHQENGDEICQRNGKLGPRILQDESKMLPTRYFGRKSKTVPSRALKRRYMGPPKGSPTPRPQEGIRGLTTDNHYFLPMRTKDPEPLPDIDVPSWQRKPEKSLFKMEGTENINDPVYEKRHQKFELDERRRKRWDLQRLREQRAGERKKQRDIEKKKPSFFPLPRQLECVEVTEQLPVLAFGHRIPLFQPCDFSLPWQVVPRRGRPSLT